MRVLLTGGAGFIGSYIRNDLTKRGYEVIAPDMAELDLTKDDVGGFVLRKNPGAIIHLAGIKDVEFCEIPDNYDTAYAINVAASKRLADAADKLGCLLIFMSSDLVYDGKRGNYREEDIPNPSSVYGRMKLEVEEYVKAHCKRHIICRTSGVYGFFKGKESFIEYVIGNLRKGEEAEAYINILNCPTLVYDLCDFIASRLDNNDCSKNELFHVCGDERLSRFEMGVKIASVFGYDKNLVKGTKKRDVILQDNSLCNARAKKMTGFTPTKLTEGLEIIREELTHD